LIYRTLTLFIQIVVHVFDGSKLLSSNKTQNTQSNNSETLLNTVWSSLQFDHYRPRVFYTGFLIWASTLCPLYKCSTYLRNYR